MARCTICNASNDTDPENWSLNFVWDTERQEYMCINCIHEICGEPDYD